MLHKLGILFLCERCEAPVHEDDIGFDGENGHCPDCVSDWNSEQIAYWKPLYDAEVAAGLHDPEGKDNA
jgi:hypothetical protein